MTEHEQAILRIARDLADVLADVARERSDDARKEMSRLHTELCAAVRGEAASKADS